MSDSDAQYAPKADEEMAVARLQVIAGRIAALVGRITQGIMEGSNSIARIAAVRSAAAVLTQLLLKEDHPFGRYGRSDYEISTESLDGALHMMTWFYIARLQVSQSRGLNRFPICDDHERMELVASFLSDTHGQEEFGEDLGGWLSDAFRNDVEESMLGLGSNLPYEHKILMGFDGMLYNFVDLYLAGPGDEQEGEESVWPSDDPDQRAVVCTAILEMGEMLSYGLGFVSEQIQSVTSAPSLAAQAGYLDPSTYFTSWLEWSEKNPIKGSDE